MRIALLDDEKKVQELLTSYIKKFGEENGIRMDISCFQGGEQFLSNYSSNYDIVCMDIEMPGLNGIETARELRRIDSRIVLMFITNMAQYAINGYEVEAIDFIVKPVSYEDFSMKFNKALRYVDRNKEHRITLATTDGIVNIYLSDVYYIEVIRHYLVYHTVNGDYTVRGVMKKVEEELDGQYFVRANHCYLINLKYIQSINGYNMNIAGEELKISRNKKSDLMIKFTEYIGGIKR